MSTINFSLDGEPKTKSLESAVATLELIAKEYVEKCNKEEREQIFCITKLHFHIVANAYIWKTCAIFQTQYLLTQKPKSSMYFHN